MSETKFYLLSDTKQRKCVSTSRKILLEKADEWMSNEIFERSLITGPSVKYEIITENLDHLIRKYIEERQLNFLKSYSQSCYNITIEEIEGF